MRAVLQRVKRASVAVDSQVIGKIDKGLLIFLGVAPNDSQNDIDILVDKISGLRIFEDENEKMNRSLKDVSGGALIISQFTLYADCKSGRRPSFTLAACAALADELYKKFIQKFRETELLVQEGKFGAMMDIELINNGPVTIILDSNEWMAK